MLPHAIPFPITSTDCKGFLPPLMFTDTQHPIGPAHTPPQPPCDVSQRLGVGGGRGKTGGQGHVWEVIRSPSESGFPGKVVAFHLPLFP